MGLQLFTTELAVHHSRNSQWIAILQFVRQGGVWKILIANGACEPINRLRAHRCCTGVCARGIRAAVNHRVTDFNAGRIAVENETAHLASKNVNQLLEFAKILYGSMDGSSQMPAQIA